MHAFKGLFLYGTVHRNANMTEMKRSGIEVGFVFADKMILSNAIFRYIQDKDGDCEVYPAPFAVFLNEDDKTYFEPDISVICDKDKLTEEGCKGAPDWIIEIASPTSRSMDYGKKLFKYYNARVREYWIVDHVKNQILVYNFEHDTLEEFTFSDKVKAGIYEDFEIDFSKTDID